MFFPNLISSYLDTLLAFCYHAENKKLLMSTLWENGQKSPTFTLKFSCPPPFFHNLSPIIIRSVFFADMTSYSNGAPYFLLLRCKILRYSKTSLKQTCSKADIWLTRTKFWPQPFFGHVLIRLPLYIANTLKRIPV